MDTPATRDGCVFDPVWDGRKVGWASWMVRFGNLQDGVVVILGLVDQMEADIDDQARDDRLYETPVLYYN